ncbi:MAG: PASTA domain-containing protein [Muribaculaceae bacterium]|nr:PASTA domain-containing protein [Muribaculaceae bacterium]
MSTSVIQKLNTFRRNHPLWTALLAMALTALLLVWMLLLFLKIWTHHGDDSTVPEIKSMTYAMAAARLDEAGLGIEISDSIYDASIPAGTVVESWPKAGSQVKRGRNVYVTVVAFSPKHVTLSMPVTGVSVRQAVSYLNALGITGIRFVNVPSQYPDLVERAHADGRPLGVGSMIPVNASVVLEVGKYVAPVEEYSDTTADEQITAEEAIYDDLAGQSSYDPE